GFLLDGLCAKASASVAGRANSSVAHERDCRQQQSVGRTHVWSIAGSARCRCYSCSFPESPVSPQTRLADVAHTHQQDILTEWVTMQLQSTGARRDLI